MGTRGFVAFCSPSGTTRRVARRIEQSLAGLGVEVNSLDLGLSTRWTAFTDMIAAMDKSDCLFIGSPVYRDLAVPPVMKFIESIPEVRQGVVLPFVTWGAVTSGIALWQMGRSFRKKGFVLAGAAAVVAEHCMMWRSETASGAGRPDAEDLQKVEGVVQEICYRLGSGALTPMDLAALDYHREDLAAEMKQKLDEPWMIVPKTVAEEKCTECGICAAQCPVDAVDLNPFPRFDETCFDCFNCVRLCPEEAIETPLSAEQIEAHIARLKEKYREVPETRVFLPPQY